MTLFVAEPAARYGACPPAVVDASLLVALVFGEPSAAEVEAMLQARALFSPSLLPFEVANAGMNKCRRQILAASVVRERLAAFDFASLRLCEVDAAAVFSVAHRFGLSAYDASYLWLAGALRAPLLTFDARLAGAARDYLDTGTVA